MQTRQLCASLCLMGLFTVQSADAATLPRNLCSLFTAEEIASLLGVAVENGEPAAMGTGCQWFGQDDTSYAIVQKVGPDTWINPQQAPGYQSIPGVGIKAYSHPDLEGGWRAMALTSDAAIAVVLIGKTPPRPKVVSLLRQLLERLSH